MKKFKKELKSKGYKAHVKTTTKTRSCMGETDTDWFLELMVSM